MIHHSRNLPAPAKQIPLRIDAVRNKDSNFRYLRLLALCVLTGLFSLPALGETEPSTPNIIVILADDMGYGDVSCYNPEGKIPTPHMDRLAAEGLRFTDAHSGSAVCSPSRYGLLTGRYAWRTRLKRGVLGGYGPPLIEKGQPTLASILRAQGYLTACIGKWHIGANFFDKEGKSTWREQQIDFTARIADGPCAVGFDEAFWHAGCGTAAPPYAFIENERFVPNTFAFQEMPHGDDGMVQEGWSNADADPTLAAKAREFIKKSSRGEQPFFLYLAPNAPHEPCVEKVVPEFARGKSEAGDRGDLVWLFDWMVGEVMRELAATGQADNTLVIVTSDNGGLAGDFDFNENGRRRANPGRNYIFKTYGHESSGPWRGHKAHTWEGGHRVPFIAWWPGQVPAAASTDSLTSLNDLMATFASLTGASFPAGSAMDSIDQLSILLGNSEQPPRRSIVNHSSFGTFAYRSGPWKLIEGTQGSGGWPTPRDQPADPGSPGQLYNLDEDPTESDNLWEERPDKVAELQQNLALTKSLEPDTN